ncbi:hypothetical protein SAMN04515671_1042 [Nakamurella panacisegetis]|uniref:Uncharacterized protein n=1 Tax=Nakamurella panacisegetis TaxID=1090615 RepID=A0A1H0JTN3_9ACTN|nr:hypothetical protein [Nakamurella panacisegetis]SDO47128.1 hypothetical protein SAMN04515671_1042 [Nakamurella panacisegetis]
MNVDTAVTDLTWLLAALAAVAVVLLVLIRRWAGRVVVIGVAALLLIVVFAVRQQIGAISSENPEPLCNGGVSWFGVHLTGPDAFCAKYRTPPS